MFHIILKFLPRCDLLVRENLLVTLEDADIHLMQIALRLTENAVGLLQETVHQPPRNGHGCIDHDDKFVNLFDLSGLHRLDQRHIAVHLQAE